MTQNRTPNKYLRQLGRDVRRDWQLYLLLLPCLCFFLIFRYYPMYGVQIAFKDFNGALGFSGSKWVGLKHFINFFNSYYFSTVIINTVLISLYTLIASFPMPIVLALMLNECRSQKFKRFVQTVTYAPHFISMVVMVGMLMVFLSPSSGLFGNLSNLMGFTEAAQRNYMAEPGMFRHLYVWSGVWQSTGWGSIIYLAALSGVDPSLHEAATIDGASRIQRVWYINIPTILPTIIILFIMNTGSIMNVGFEKAYLMQNDLNKSTSEVISTYVYKRGLLQADYSFASAVGLFNNVINFAMVSLVNFISKRLGDTSLW